MKSTTRLQTLFSRLNTQQRKAVEMTEGPVMVIAGPGTGKTQIITLRIAHILLHTHANPNNILALTFTENAAAEMKQRLYELIGPDAYKVNIHTFHAFCNELIQKHSHIFHHLLSFEPVSDLERVEIVQDCIETNSFQLLRPHGDPGHYYQPSLSAISTLKKEGVTPEMFVKAVHNWKHDFENRDDLIHTKGKYKGKMKGEAQTELRHIQLSSEFCTVFNQYQKELKNRKLYDYEDMIIEVLAAFQTHEDFLTASRETYQYILVDEHQDTNNAQNAIIELLCGMDDYPNLFVVGDEKQSIFRFQGASLENFLYFKKLYPRASLIYLQDNYRSTQAILDSAHALIKHNPKSISSDTVLEAKHSVENIKLKVTQYMHSEQELSSIAQTIVALHEKGIPFKEMAVLYKKNEDLYTLARVFDKVGISYRLSTSESIFADFYIEKLIFLLKSIQSCGDDIPFSRLFLMDIFNVHPLAFFEAQQVSSEKKVSLWSLIKDQTVNIAPEVREVGLNLCSWKKRSENTPIDIFFLEVLHESGLFNQIMKQPNSLSVLHKLSIVYEDIKSLQKKNHTAFLNEYITHLDLLEKHNIQPHTSVPTLESDQVSVSTVHKAKGLEFTVVFIPHVVDGYWGNAKSRSPLLTIPWKYLSRTHMIDETGDRIEEERRLFYVGITRAKQYLYISYSVKDATGKTLLPSQFIHELPQEHISVTPQRETDDDVKNRIISTLAPSLAAKRQFAVEDIREYILERYSKNGLSVSALNNFIICPWRYIFRNLIRLPDVRGYYLLLGTLIHSVIREFIVQLKKGNTYTPAELITYMNTIVDRFAANERDIQKLKDQGALIINAYFEKRMAHWDTRRDAEVVVPNILFKDDIFINGKIDMIEYNKDKTVTVYDFKTGKTKSRNEIVGLTKKADKSYFRQLVFYKLLLDNYKNKMYHMQHGVIEFVESAIDGSVRQETFEITPHDIEELKQQIVSMKSSLQTLSFWNTRCDDEKCEYCVYQPHLTQMVQNGESPRNTFQKLTRGKKSPQETEL